MDGFLPSKEPIKDYSVKSESCLRIRSIASNLPKLLLTGQLQPLINSLKDDDLSIEELLINKLTTDIKLAMLDLSFIAHGYVWGDKNPNQSIPYALSKPWVQAAHELNRPPVLSYASYCLDNWYRINQGKKISLENVALINNFLGGVDEDWFVTIHVCIENAASGAISNAHALSKITEDEAIDEISLCINNITKSLKQVNKIFARMPEKCDPYIYYHRVRPFIFGSKDNPDLKKGLIYEGMFDNKPRFYRGETGAQSSIIPSLDAALQIKHSNDSLRHYLNEMRDYMPKKHRNFIASLEQSSKTRSLISQSKKLQDQYNQCLEEIRLFRSMHLQYADTYIHQQSQVKNPFGRGGSTITGTGGTPFMSYLKKHRDETEKHKK